MAGNRRLGLVALLVVLGRFPSWLWPLRPDEAGFLLVAQSWSPTADSVYGPYWVDRPPPVIALFGLADWVGGPYFLRVVALLGCVLAVYLAGWLGREVVRHLPSPPDVVPGWVALGPAAVTAALLCSPQIDAAAAKGELLGVPVLMGACLLALRALRLRSGWLALAAGVCAVSAVGLKQNLVGGIVFGAALLVGARVAGQIDWRTLGRLTLAAALGGCVPVAATVGWAVVAGVNLSELWYVVVGFRGDANALIVEQPSSAPLARAQDLFVAFWATGMGLVLVWYLARLPHTVRRIPVVAVAAGAMLAGDVAALMAGGSFWRPYLFVLVPPLAMACAVAVVPRLEGRPPLPWLGRTVVGLCALSTVVSLVGWTQNWAAGAPPREFTVGRDIGRFSEDGDTLTVYGGRADIQWASGLDSPYPYLWSLPMRTLDPGLEQLDALLGGPDAPTWFVEAVPLDSWSTDGVPGLRAALDSRYEELGTFCGPFVVHRLRSAPPVEGFAPSCEQPWRRSVLDALPDR